jgi:hypothetical protein
LLPLQLFYDFTHGRFFKLSPQLDKSRVIIIMPPNLWLGLMAVDKLIKVAERREVHLG